MTLVVETPQGDRQGSSVVWIRHWFYPQILPDAGHQDRKWGGEAAVVDLGEGKFLFALPINGDPIYGAFGDLLSQKTTGGKEYYRVIEGLVGLEARQVPLGDLPTLVTFTDVNDPTSIALVDPHDIAKSFGDGYTLKSAFVEVTRDPVTSGQVGQVLDWMDGYSNWMPVQGLDGRTKNLSSRYFIRKPDYN